MLQTSPGAWALIVRIIVSILIVGLIGERLGAVLQTLPDADFAAQTSVFWLSLLSPAYWISKLAPLCYIFALWAAGDVLSALSKGQAFTSAFMKGVKEVAANLGYGAAAAIVISPTVSSVIGARPSLIFRPDVESLTLGLIGLTLWLIATRGAKLHSEMESFV